MVWAGFAANGTTPIVFLDKKVDSSVYQDMLAENLLSMAFLITSEDYLFQQDNATIRVSSASKSWFEANIVGLAIETPAQTLTL